MYLTGCVRQSDVYRGKRRRLSDIDQRFTCKFQQREKMHDGDRGATRWIKQIPELDELRLLQRFQDRAHMLAHRKFLAVDVMPCREPSALDDFGPCIAQIDHVDFREALLQRLFCLLYTS